MFNASKSNDFKNKDKLRQLTNKVDRQESKIKKIERNLKRYFGIDLGSVGGGVLVYERVLETTPNLREIDRKLNMLLDHLGLEYIPKHEVGGKLIEKQPDKEDN